MRITTIEQFKERANFIHNNKYNYDKFIYNGCLLKGIITCPIHGEFLQSSNNHINQKQGCCKCGMLNISGKLIGITLLKTRMLI